MKIFSTIDKMIFGKMRERKANKIKEAEAAEQEIQKKDKELEMERREEEEARLIFKYPVVEMTREELTKIPNGDAVPIDFLQTCPVGTKFICRKNRFLPDLVIIGKVVKGENLFCAQWGAGLLSIPDRGINRYRVEII